MNLSDAVARHAAHTLGAAHEQAQAYDEHHDVHLSGYLGSLAAYGLAAAGVAVLGRATGHPLPDRYRVTDVALGGAATYKFSRMVAKASVVSPLRAPFTRFEKAAGSAELTEQPRGGGVRRTVGELLTCPFCLGQWVASGYVTGLVLVPRAARTWAAVFTVTAISDSLQHLYARVRTD